MRLLDVGIGAGLEGRRAGCYGAIGAEGSGLNGDSGAAAVGDVGGLWVLGCGLVEAKLGGQGSGVGFVHGNDFGGVGGGVDAAATAVVADVVDGSSAELVVVVDDGVGVDVGDGAAYVGDGAVVEEVAVVPVAAEVAGADVSVAVVDAAVEADVETPVAVAPAVATAVPTPVGRGPEGAVVGREHPDAGHPVEANRSVCPVAGGPDVVVGGGGGLVVVREGRGRLVGEGVGVGGGVVERSFTGCDLGVCLRGGRLVGDGVVGCGSVG